MNSKSNEMNEWLYYLLNWFHFCNAQWRCVARNIPTDTFDDCHHTHYSFITFILSIRNKNSKDFSLEMNDFRNECFACVRVAMQRNVVGWKICLEVAKLEKYFACSNTKHLFFITALYINTSG